MTTNRPLRVFLCHSSHDKPAVRELYQQLRAEAWIQPWLDEEELYPGQDWNLEIEKAVEASDAILVCLSKGSVTKEGYVQRELRIVLDLADYKPEGTLFVIPVRLEECEPPRRLRTWQYADYFEGQRERALQRLLVSLKKRADSMGLETDLKKGPSAKARLAQKYGMAKPVSRKEKTAAEKQKSSLFEPPTSEWIAANKLILSNGMEFMLVPAGKFLMGSKSENKQANYDEIPPHPVDISYDYWMTRFTVTNYLYNEYAKAKGIMHPVNDWKQKKDHPVVNVKWTDAMEYCQWLNGMLKKELPSGLVLRIPTEAEWEKAARGTDGREYPWGDEFDKNKCNSSEGGKGDTTSVSLYSPRGDAPYGCADMAGNVWEWTHSLKKGYPYRPKDGRENQKASGTRVLRGGSFDRSGWYARCACRYDDRFGDFDINFGFRVVVAPKLP